MPMSLLAATAALALPALLQTAQPPVLAFPEPGLDDPAAYQGYATRFFRDARGNAVQIYLDSRSGRVVHVWADATNASAAFSVRDPGGAPLTLGWGGSRATATGAGGVRRLSWRLTVDRPAVQIGWWLLGTMRQERDFQYGDWHRRSFDAGPFVLPELGRLVDRLSALPAEEQAAHLALLRATSVEQLRARLAPEVSLTRRGRRWTLIASYRALDGGRSMTVELRSDVAQTPSLRSGVLTVQAAVGGSVTLDVTVTTDAPTLTPLRRDQLLSPAFRDHLASRQRVADSLRRARAARDPRVLAARRMERQVRALELLSSREKLMASLPNYATYFGRDMMMTALMLEPVTTAAVQELVIGAVLAKVDSTGDVSHEEALDGQAIRENAAEYADLIRRWEAARDADPAAAAALLARARDRLRALTEVRENHRMIDDDFQLAVLVDRWLRRPDVTDARKRAFLQEAGADGRSRLGALLRNLALVARRAAPYARDPVPTNLVGFEHRDAEGWQPGSWRDSRAGYANGRFAMDVNVVWVPKALEAAGRILADLDRLGLGPAPAIAALGGGAELAEYARRPEALASARATWEDARRHFVVRLEPEAMRRSIDAWLAAQPADARALWRSRLTEDATDRRLTFLALSLDEAGRPIPALHTDPGTELFLGDATAQVLAGADPTAILASLDGIGRPFPTGLFVDRLGPVVVNDVYAPAAVQRRFVEDTYQSPTVVWGREVNLLVLGLARQIAAAHDAAGRLRSDAEPFRGYVASLRDLLHRINDAVEASGLRHNELWSYAIEGGTLRPVRYGTSSDIQLWNITDLAIGFTLARLPRP